jgi:predicted adenylyl cyclase CyaB
MPLEIEKRFKNFNYIEMIKNFKKIGIKNMENQMQIFSSYIGIKKDQSIRIRIEGDKTTFTIKQKNAGNYDSEWEVVVNDYNMIDKMLSELNIKKKYQMEKYREIYLTKNGKNEIVFDHYPGLPPYMEIESSSEAELKKTMKILNLVDEQPFSAKDLYYDLYGITKSREDSDLTFKNANKLMGNYILKNKTKFYAIIREQKKIFFK